MLFKNCFTVAVPGKFPVRTVLPEPLEPLEYLLLVKVRAAQAELHVVGPQVVAGGKVAGLDLNTGERWLEREDNIL